MIRVRAYDRDQPRSLAFANDMPGPVVFDAADGHRLVTWEGEVVARLLPKQGRWALPTHDDPRVEHPSGDAMFTHLSVEQTPLPVERRAGGAVVSTSSVEAAKTRRTTDSGEVCALTVTFTVQLQGELGHEPLLSVAEREREVERISLLRADLQARAEGLWPGATVMPPDEPGVSQ